MINRKSFLYLYVAKKFSNPLIYTIVLSNNDGCKKKTWFATAALNSSRTRHDYIILYIIIYYIYIKLYTYDRRVPVKSFTIYFNSRVLSVFTITFRFVRNNI